MDFSSLIRQMMQFGLGGQSQPQVAAPINIPAPTSVAPGDLTQYPAGTKPSAVWNGEIGAFEIPKPAPRPGAMETLLGTVPTDTWAQKLTSIPDSFIGQLLGRAATGFAAGMAGPANVSQMGQAYDQMRATEREHQKTREFQGAMNEDKMQNALTRQNAASQSAYDRLLAGSDLALKKQDERHQQILTEIEERGKQAKALAEFKGEQVAEQKRLDRETKVVLEKTKNSAQKFAIQKARDEFIQAMNNLRTDKMMGSEDADYKAVIAARSNWEALIERAGQESQLQQLPAGGKVSTGPIKKSRFLVEEVK